MRAPMMQKDLLSLNEPIGRGLTGKRGESKSARLASITVLDNGRLVDMCAALYTEKLEHLPQRLVQERNEQSKGHTVSSVYDASRPRKMTSRLWGLD